MPSDRRRLPGQLRRQRHGCPGQGKSYRAGPLIINEHLAITDEETVAQIRGNPYLQYFLGLHEYLRENLFDSSMMVHFRKRISPELLGKINLAIICRARTQAGFAKDPPASSPDQTTPFHREQNPIPSPELEPKPNGKLPIDATCTPADITYPTNLKLLNEAREKTERIINDLHTAMPGKVRKPRTYREKARRDFLSVALSKKTNATKIRTGIGKQLRDIKRKGTLQRVMAKLATTSRTVVAIGLIVMNLDALLRILRALIQPWPMWQFLLMAKFRTPSYCDPSQRWIYIPATKLRAAPLIFHPEICTDFFSKL